MTDAQQAAKYLRSLTKNPSLNLEAAEALEGAATIIEGLGRNESALLKENDQLRESVASLLALVEELEPGGFPEGHWPHEAVTKARAALEAEAGQ